jgi:hypothetical protein
VSEGRTVWWAKDAAWWRREYIVALGEEFGPLGPAIVDWLAGEAKAQNDAGRVKTGYRSLARGCFADDLVTVRHAVSRAVALGALDDLVEDGERFTCRISGWKSEQDRALAARRKAESRARKAYETEVAGPVVTSGHALSRPVTDCPSTGQDSTKEEEEVRASNGVLHPDLDAVIAVCQEAGLDCEPMAVNSALQASRKHDAMDLARVVASWAAEGGLNIRSANRLLLSAARKADEAQARQDGIRAAAEQRESTREPTTRQRPAGAADPFAYYGQMADEFERKGIT